jgi:site-specific recombinase XerD
MERAIDTFRQRLRLRRYVKNTIKTYFGCLSKFIQAFEAHDLGAVAEKDIERYLPHLVEKKGVSDSH